MRWNVDKCRIVLGVLICLSLPACGGGAAAVNSAVHAGAEAGARAGAEAADDVARAAIRAGADDAARVSASTAGRRLSSEVAIGQRAVRSTNGRVSEIVRSYAADERVQEATFYLVWDIGCEISTDSLPEDVDVVAQRLLRRSAEFGLRFVSNEALQSMAYEVLDAFGLDEKDESYEACVQIAG